jgi:serine protease Do
MKVVIASVVSAILSAAVLAQPAEHPTAPSGATSIDLTTVAGTILADMRAFEAAELGLALAPTPHGELLVVGISSESPAARAGIRRGDFILRIDGHDVASTKDLKTAIHGETPHESVKLTMWRGGKETELDLLLLAADGPMKPERRPWAGLQCDEVPDKGLVIKAVYPGGPAANAGLKVGDVIVSADGKTIRSFIDAEKYLRQLQPFAEAKLVVLRDGDRLNMNLKMASLRTTPGGLVLETRAQNSEPSSTAPSPELQMQTLTLEQLRWEAEQRQRLEQLLQEIRQDVKQLRTELAALKNKE